VKASREISSERREALELDSHPGVADLGLYHEGSLPDGAMKKLQRHLVLCSTCMGLLLDLASFLDESPENSALTNEELEAAWEALQHRRRSEASQILASAAS
jgi:hypothetical protein